MSLIGDILLITIVNLNMNNIKQLSLLKVPNLQDMLRFAQSVKEWLNADPENVIVVHCKGNTTLISIAEQSFFTSVKVA